jgi:hypothetical protein
VQEAAAAVAVLAVRAEFGVDGNDRLAFVPVQLREVLGAGAAAEDEEDVTAEHLALADDPSHAPAGWRGHEAEI